MLPLWELGAPVVKCISFFPSIVYCSSISIQRVPGTDGKKLNMTGPPLKQEHDGPTGERGAVRYHCNICSRNNQGYVQSVMERQRGSDSLFLGKL